MTSTNSSLKFLGDESLVKMISNGYMWWHDERLTRSFIRRKLLSPQPQRLVHFFEKKIKISRLSLPLSKPHCIAPWSTEPNLHSYEHIYRFIISLYRLQIKYAWEGWWYLNNYILYNRDSKLLWRPTWKVENSSQLPIHHLRLDKRNTGRTFVRISPELFHQVWIMIL